MYAMEQDDQGRIALLTEPGRGECFREAFEAALVTLRHGDGTERVCIYAESPEDARFGDLARMEPGGKPVALITMIKGEAWRSVLEIAIEPTERDNRMIGGEPMTATWELCLRQVRELSELGMRIVRLSKMNLDPELENTLKVWRARLEEVEFMVQRYAGIMRAACPVPGFGTGGLTQPEYRTQQEANGKWSVYRGAAYVKGPFDFEDEAQAWIDRTLREAQAAAFEATPENCPAGTHVVFMLDPIKHEFAGRVEDWWPEGGGLRPVLSVASGTRGIMERKASEAGQSELFARLRAMPSGVLPGELGVRIIRPHNPQGE